jgi:hypothetical protein
MQTVEYQVVDANGWTVAKGPNRQQPIKTALMVHQGGWVYPLPFKVVRISTETETIGWVI